MGYGYIVGENLKANFNDFVLKKLTSKEGQKRLLEYERSTHTTLDTIYKFPSLAKRNAFYRIVKRAMDEHGTQVRVISANTETFTTAYKVVRDNIFYLVVDTKTKTTYYY